MDGAEKIPLPESDSMDIPEPVPASASAQNLGITFQHLVTAVGSQEATMQRHEEALSQWGALMQEHASMLNEIHQALQLNRPTRPAQPHQMHPAPQLQQAQMHPAPPLGQQAQVTAPAATSTERVASHPTPSREPRLPTPERYSGDPKGCKGFLTQCRLSFDLQPAAYPTEHSRVAYVITLLTGRALSWATALYDNNSPVCNSLTAFSKEMMKVFAPDVSGRTAANKLMQLRQGRQSATDYAIQFRTLAAESGWGEQALLTTFYHGLSDRIKDELASWEEAENLEVLIARVIRLDHRLQERTKTPRRFYPYAVPVNDTPVPQSSDGGPEPMQLGGTRLSQVERDRRMREHCCLYCGKPGHFRNACPELMGKAKPRPAPGDL